MPICSYFSISNLASNISHLFIVGCFLFGQLNPLIAQAIPCDGTAYYFVSNANNNSSNFYRIQLNDSPSFELIKSNIPHDITAAAYRFIDQHIYALDVNTNELLRIDVLGNVDVLGIPENLNTDLLYASGTISTSGRHLIVIGKDKQSLQDELIHTIQLYDDRYYAGVTSVINDFNASVDDISSDPLRGIAYGFDRTSRKLVSIRLGDGFITNFFAQNQSNVGRIGSLFFNPKGQLYGIGGGSTSSDSKFYAINKLNGVITDLEVDVPSGSLTDACACPYNLQVLQRVQPRTIAPCEEFTLTYQLINHTASARSFTTFTDSLPPNFSITAILEKPFSGTVSGIGTNIFQLERSDLLLDTNTIILKVRADEFAEGFYESRPNLSGSFDNIPIRKSTTIWEVSNMNLIALENSLELDCETGELSLCPSIENAQFEWNTGDTTNTLRITETGTYSVTATLACVQATDEINITELPNPLQLALETPSQLEAGRSITLTAQSNNTIVNYQWSAAPSTAFSCLNCPNPSVAPLEKTRFSLLATDIYGCTASDNAEIEVLLKQDIYSPTAFSPNQDGINDFFYLQGIESIATIVQIQIFNRWGTLVFEQENIPLNDQKAAWDGTIKGKTAATGTYFWTAQLEYANGARQRQSGVLHLLR